MRVCDDAARRSEVTVIPVRRRGGSGAVLLRIRCETHDTLSYLSTHWCSFRPPGVVRVTCVERSLSHRVATQTGRRSQHASAPVPTTSSPERTATVQVKSRSSLQAPPPNIRGAGPPRDKPVHPRTLLSELQGQVSNFKRPGCSVFQSIHTQRSPGAPQHHNNSAPQPPHSPTLWASHAPPTLPLPTARTSPTP